jgi:gamma-glutamyl phosphate reductase
MQQLRAEAAALRAELEQVKEARDKAQSIANTANTVLISEKVAQEQLLAQSRQLEADNRRLRDEPDFEKLIPTAGATGIAIRGLQAEVANGRS